MARYSIQVLVPSAAIVLLCSSTVSAFVETHSSFFRRAVAVDRHHHASLMMKRQRRQSLSSTCRTMTTLHNTSNRNEELRTTKMPVMDVIGIKQVAATVMTMAALVLFVATTTPLSTLALSGSDDDASEITIRSAVSSIQDATGDPIKTLAAFENVAEIITEGKGVGGSLSYTGVTLERGYVADEDTNIYNPGLTLLTESEKERILSAVLQNRKMSADGWSQDLEFASDFLKQKLDPLHMVELKGYLGILPYWGAFVYAATVAIQQWNRDIFTTAYILGVVFVFGPVLVLIALGPQ